MLRIDRAVFVLAALLLLTLPLNWLFSAIMAAVFHELCHIMMIFAVKGSIQKIKIGISGAKIQISPMEVGKELICALAGPAGSLLLACCFRRFPGIAVCAGIQAAFNLLPVYPLDGGRALRCVLQLLGPKAETLELYIEKATVFFIWGLAIWGCFVRHLGIFPLMPAALLTIKKNSLQSGESRGTIVLHHFMR